MSLEKLTQNLEKLVFNHKNLNEIARKKTDIIVKGDFQALQLILKDENKHILLIQKLNNEMLNAGKSFLQENKILDETPTLATVIVHANEKDKPSLNQLKKDLEEQVVILQDQNRMNQELLEESLQFINMSLDLLMPDMESFNYSLANEDEKKEAHSIFDSKA